MQELFVLFVATKERIDATVHSFSLLRSYSLFSVLYTNTKFNNIYLSFLDID